MNSIKINSDISTAKYNIVCSFNSELWLSTSDQPANKVKIASVHGYTGSRAWTKYPSQQSVSINFSAGVRYYIEARHKEATQGDNLSVGWQLHNGSLERPIPGIRLSPYSTSTVCAIPIITPLGPTTICSGSVTLQSNTGSGYFYQWKKDGVNITEATNSSYAAIVSGSYQVKTIQGSSISWSSPKTVKIQNGLSASTTPGGSTTFCSGGNVKLYANTCSGYTYQWKKNGSNITGGTRSTYIATTSRNYQVQVTQSGVNAWLASVIVTVNGCRESEISPIEETNLVQVNSELSDSLADFQMKIFPNPNTGLFTIVLNMTTVKEEKVKMRILNVLGQDVYYKEYIIKDNYNKETMELEKSLPQVFILFR